MVISTSSPSTSMVMLPTWVPLERSFCPAAAQNSKVAESSPASQNSAQPQRLLLKSKASSVKKLLSPSMKAVSHPSRGYSSSSQSLSGSFGHSSQPSAIPSLSESISSS